MFTVNYNKNCRLYTVVFKAVMGFSLFQENGFLFISPEDLILYFVFFLRTSSEYLARYGQGSVEITDPCIYFFEYSLDVIKK